MPGELGRGTQDEEWRQHTQARRLVEATIYIGKLTPASAEQNPPPTGGAHKSIARCTSTLSRTRKPFADKWGVHESAKFLPKNGLSMSFGPKYQIASALQREKRNRGCCTSQSCRETYGRVRKNVRLITTSAGMRGIVMGQAR